MALSLEGKKIPSWCMGYGLETKVLRWTWHSQSLCAIKVLILKKMHKFFNHVDFLRRSLYGSNITSMHDLSL